MSHDLEHSGLGPFLYLCAGLLVAYCMSMNMDAPLTWLAIVFWPAVLLFEMFAVVVKIWLGVAALVGVALLFNVCCSRVHDLSCRRLRACKPLARGR